MTATEHALGAAWLRTLLVAALSVSVVGCPAQQSDTRAAPGPAAAASVGPSRVVTVDRSGKLRLFPCEDCHGSIHEAVAATDLPRKHKGIHTDHFDGVRRCFVCHNADDMNQLRLLSGATVPFGQASQVCGQCHGEKQRDFEIGAHGKHVGEWSKTKYRYGCADCHDPHKPGHAQVTALPPPPFPELGIKKGGAHD